MKLVYLASPYSNPLVEIRRKRGQACWAALAYFTMKRNNRYAIYSPIAHWMMPAEMFKLPFDSDYWILQDIDMIRRSAELWVLNLQGTKLSKGVAAEIQAAKDYELPIRYVEREKSELMLSDSPQKAELDPDNLIALCTDVRNDLE